jgi:hypothetical protein
MCWSYQNPGQGQAQLVCGGYGVAHTVAHTTPVRVDLGSILHTPKPRTAFIRKLSSPFFQTTDLKQCNFVMSSGNK